MRRKQTTQENRMYICNRYLPSSDYFHRGVRDVDGKPATLPTFLRKHTENIMSTSTAHDRYSNMVLIRPTEKVQDRRRKSLNNTSADTNSQEQYVHRGTRGSSAHNIHRRPAHKKYIAGLETHHRIRTIPGRLGTAKRKSTTVPPPTNEDYGETTCKCWGIQAYDTKIYIHPTTKHVMGRLCTLSFVKLFT